MKRYEMVGMTKDEYKAMCQEIAKIGNWEYAISQAEARIANLYAKIAQEQAKIDAWKKKIADAT